MTNLTPVRYAERHRPAIHFSPPQNWMNDPNGMVYYNGVYHLFYQYNPADKVWADMHWGHATSTDLLMWTHKPVALHSDPDGLGFVFSGCAVVDRQNTTGFGINGKPPLVALFTHSSRSGEQVQSLAYSIDAGDNWLMHAGNPVIANPGIADFRDPKVFWDDRFKHWVMVIAAGSVIKFYRSPDLLEWEHFHDFGDSVGAHGGCWECPDLFPLNVDGQGVQKWVLLVSMNPGGPNGGSATQYFVGDFDGEQFRTDQTEELWLDYGPDNYAGVTWSDLPQTDSRRILMGWMSNWDYANHVPTDPWRGAMTVARELALVSTNSGLRLSAAPVRELERLRTGEPLILESLKVKESLVISPAEGLNDALDVQITIDRELSADVDCVLRFYNQNGEELKINLHLSCGQIDLCRAGAAADMEQHGDFVRPIKAPFPLNNPHQAELRIVKDASSIELFSEQGLALLTVSYFTRQPLTQFEIMPMDNNGRLALKKLTIHELDNIWT